MKPFSLYRRWVVLFTVSLLAIFTIYGCGGSGSGSSSQGDDTGEVSISLTDAAGDFVTYTVDVQALTLTRSDGTIVSTMPGETRIDFSQYTEMTEFLTAATVPAGRYTAATLTLDYTNADIRVENDSGDSVQVALENIIDDNGNAITILEMTVQLEDRNRLTIARGIPAHLLLDFDLEATHTVNLDNPSAPVITVDPILVADVNRMPSKIHRIRGTLDEVDLAESSFTLNLRPFRCPMSGNHSDFGTQTVTVSSETLYEIDGTAYTGQSGLEAMAALDAGTAVIATGDLKFDPYRFEAQEVYAGTSVPGGDADVVRGSVVAREGDSLTVKGGTVMHRGGGFGFSQEVTVLVSEDTVVNRLRHPGDGGDYTKDDISVGQKIEVFGTLSGEDDNLVMDATTDEDHVRMLLTTISGTAVVVDESGSQVTVALESIDHRTVDNFDFSGTGSDPDTYLVNTGTIDISSIDTDDPIKIRGFVQGFGAAPPDFEAQTIINVSQLRAMMNVDWHPSTNEAFESVSTDGLTLNLEGSERIHHVFQGGIPTDLTQLSQAPSVVPQADDQGQFSIGNANDGTLDMFTVFSEFATALMSDIEAGELVKHLHAVGEFDEASVTLTADVIHIQFAPTSGPR